MGRKQQLRYRVPSWQRLSREQVRDLSLAHHANLDQIATGQAIAATLWQWVGGVLTWSKAAELMGAGMPEMTEQLELAHAVLERYRRTGRVGFTGPEYQAAKTGVQVMDALAEIVTRAKAIEAANWSERRTNAMQLGERT